MRKIELVIPEWVKDGVPIYIFAGREVIARWRLGEQFEVKVVRCDFCGECCRNVPEGWPFGREEDGTCSGLVGETIRHADGQVDSGYFCMAKGDAVPFTCCRGSHSDPDVCCIRFKPR